MGLNVFNRSGKEIKIEKFGKNKRYIKLSGKHGPESHGLIEINQEGKQVSEEEVLDKAIRWTGFKL